MYSLLRVKLVKHWASHNVTSKAIYCVLFAVNLEKLFAFVINRSCDRKGGLPILLLCICND